MLVPNIELYSKNKLLSSNANNSANASLGNFNSNNEVSNVNTNVGFRYIYLISIELPFEEEEPGDPAPWQKMT